MELTEDDCFIYLETLINNQYWDDADNFINRVARFYTNNALLYHCIGRIKLHRLNGGGAIENLSKAIELDPKRDLSYYFRGFAYYYQKEYNLAEKDFLKAVEHAEYYYYDYYYCCALVNKKLGNYLTAIRYLNVILDREQNRTEIWRLKKECYFLLREFESAILICSKVLTLVIDDVNDVNSLGFAYLLNGDYRKAIAYFDKCLKLDDCYAFAYNNKGYCLMMLGNVEEALALVNISLKYNSFNSWAYRNRALIFLKTGQRERAKADLLYAKQIGNSDIMDNNVDALLKEEFNIVS